MVLFSKFKTIKKSIQQWYNIGIPTMFKCENNKNKENEWSRGSNDLKKIILKKKFKIEENQNEQIVFFRVVSIFYNKT